MSSPALVLGHRVLDSKFGLWMDPGGQFQIWRDRLGAVLVLCGLGGLKLLFVLYHQPFSQSQILGATSVRG